MMLWCGGRIRGEYEMFEPRERVRLVTRGEGSKGSKGSKGKGARKEARLRANKGECVG